MRRIIFVGLMVVLVLSACSKSPITPAPMATLTVTPLLTTAPTITPTSAPDLLIDLLPFIHNDSVTYDANTIVMNNLQSTNWAGAGAGPFPIESPFRLKIQSTSQGDFGGITFYGAIKTPETNYLPRIVINPAGQITFIDDQTGIHQDFNFSNENEKPFYLNFLDQQGKQIEVVTETDQVVMHIDVTTDLTGIALPNGLFPDGEFFFEIQTAPKSKLEVAQLAMQVRPTSAYGTAIDAKCSLSVGEQEVVLSNSTLRTHGLTSWPDTIMGVWRDGDEYHFLAANPLDSGYLRYSALASGTLDNPIASSIQSNIPIQNVKDTFGYIGGGPVYRDPQTGTLLMFYDTEKYPPGSGVHTLFTPVHNTTGMAKSTDNGKTWTDLGVVLDTQFPGWADWNVGTGNGPFVVKDDYFYLYFTDTLVADPRFDIGLSVARAKAADVLKAAINENTVVPWMKYYQGGWNQPGLGGKSSPLEIGNPQSTNFDVSYNEFLGRYIKINQSDKAGSTNLYLSESEDGIHWTLRVPIDESAGDKIYPTIVGLGDDPRITDADFYVYYIFTPDWAKNAHADTFLARRKISCQTGQ